MRLRRGRSGDAYHLRFFPDALEKVRQGLHQEKNREVFHEMISVLYVEDDADLIEITRFFLEMSQEIVLTGCTVPFDVAVLLRQQHFDVLVIDYEMPGKNGIDLLVEIKAGGNGTPVILFTGNDRDEIIARAFGAGADYCLLKGGGEPRQQFAELQRLIRLLYDNAMAGEIMVKHEPVLVKP